MKVISKVVQGAVNLWRPGGVKRPLWFDLSANQGWANFPVLVENGGSGFALRAGISWGYTDWTWEGWWQAIGQGWTAEERPYRTSYHVLYTDQPIIRQADAWYAVHEEPDSYKPVPRVIDFEVERGDSPAHKAAALWEMVEVVQARDGMMPWIYSRYHLVNTWLASWTAPMLNGVYWWLAQYLFDRSVEHPGPATLPGRVERSRVILHQTADKKAGPAGGVGSAALDYDRWEQGSEAQMGVWLAGKYHAWVVDIPGGDK